MARLMVTGGGTGGHIYPAISIARAFLDRVPGSEVLYVGTAEGMEAGLVPRAGLPFAAIPAAGLVRKSPREFAAGLWRTGRGVLAAGRLVARFRPDLVLGTGGYVSGPVVAAALARRIPVAIQEQNAIPGVANRWLGRRAKRIYVAYEEAARYFPQGRTLLTGNPVREEVLAADREEARRRWGIPPGERLVLIVMGSRGSATVNRAVVEALPRLAAEPGLHLLFVTGEAHHAEIRKVLDSRGMSFGGPGHIRIEPYLHDFPSALAASDLVVARAGAMTLAELTARGLPALLIPSPHVTHRHQEANAEALRRAGAAALLPEAGLDGGSLAGEVLALVRDAPGLARMAAASRAAGRPGALSAIVEDLCWWLPR